MTPQSSPTPAEIQRLLGWMAMQNCDCNPDTNPDGSTANCKSHQKVEAIAGYIRQLEQENGAFRKYLEDTPCTDDEYIAKTGQFLESHPL